MRSVYIRSSLFQLFSRVSYILLVLWHYSNSTFIRHISTLIENVSIYQSKSHGVSTIIANFFSVDCHTGLPTFFSRATNPFPHTKINDDIVSSRMMLLEVTPAWQTQLLRFNRLSFGVYGYLNSAQYHALNQTPQA